MTVIGFAPGSLFSFTMAALAACLGWLAGWLFTRRAWTGQVAAGERANVELQRSRLEQEQILNSAAEGILRLDSAGRVTFANPAALEMLGWTAEELVGQLAHAVIHHSRADGSAYPIDECPIYAAVKHNLSHGSDSEVYWRKDGTNFPVDTRVSPIRDSHGRAFGAVTTFVDISKRRALEELKNQFVSTVSHELRTPLTSIRGALGLLAAGRVGALTSAAQRMVTIGLENSERLIRLINDILDLERLTARQMPMTKQVCDAKTLVGLAVDGLRPIADKVGIRLQVESDQLEVWADSDRIVQTLTNLVSNAIKFSEAGQRISIGVQQRRNEVVFSVADRGPGIPPEKLEMVFERFRQADASDTRAKGGSGLGLAICRSIVLQHGGRIWAESEPGKGSTFYFTLAAATQASEPGRVSAPSRLLICDDDDMVRSVLQELLELHGYDVIAVANGGDAIAHAVTDRPDAILLDLMMPGVNGWETMSLLKKRSESANIPVIVISAFSPQHEEGVDFAAWLAKPVQAGALYDTISRVLGTPSPSADPELAHAEAHSAH